MADIVNAANCSVAAGSGGAFVVTKNGGANGVQDASAVSAAAIAGDAVLRVKLLGTGLCYVGLSSAPLASVTATSIERGVQINGGVCRPADGGLIRPGSFALDTYVWVRRSADTIQLLSGPALATATVRRTVADGGAALFFDSTIATAGLALEVKFDVPAAFATLRRRPRRGLTLGIAL
jgi:hypothetical protein